MKQPAIWGALVVAVLSLSAPEAAARRGGIFVYNTGQEAFSCGPLPAPYAEMPELAGYSAAYMCDVTGVFWSYFSVRNCKPVAVRGDSYVDEPELVAAIKSKYSEGDMQRGIWGRFGWMLMLLGVLGAAGVWAWGTFFARDEAAQPAEAEAASTHVAGR